MRASTIISTATILGSHLALGAALPVQQVEERGLTPSLPKLTDPSFDTSECLWKSEDGFYVAFIALIPGGDSANFKKALKGNSACNSYSQYHDEMVGAKAGTLLSTFWASDFCTADDITKIINKAGGQTINCNKYDSKEAGGPDPDALLAEMWEDGDDGEDGTFKRDTTTVADGIFGVLTTNGTMPTVPAAFVGKPHPTLP